MKAVAVTTSADRAAAAAIPFALLGMQPALLPCIEIEAAPLEALEAARGSAAEADLVVISSRRTIDILWPDGPLPDAEFAAVGAVSARAVRERGGRIVATGIAGSAYLAETLAPRIGGLYVVWPRAQGADPMPLLQMTSRSGRFVAPAVYSSVPVAPRLESVEVITFASPSAVTGWQLSRSLDESTIAVLGETTRRAVESSGGSAAIVAPNPTYQWLAQAVAEHLGVAV